MPSETSFSPVNALLDMAGLRRSGEARNGREASGEDERPDFGQMISATTHGRQVSEEAHARIAARRSARTRPEAPQPETPQFGAPQSEPPIAPEPAPKSAQGENRAEAAKDLPARNDESRDGYMGRDEAGGLVRERVSTGETAPDETKTGTKAEAGTCEAGDEGKVEPETQQGAEVPAPENVVIDPALVANPQTAETAAGKAEATLPVPTSVPVVAAQTEVRTEAQFVETDPQLAILALGAKASSAQPVKEAATAASAGNADTAEAGSNAGGTFLDLVQGQETGKATPEQGDGNAEKAGSETSPADAAANGVKIDGQAALGKRTANFHPIRAGAIGEILESFHGAGAIHRPADILAGLDRGLAATAMNRSAPEASRSTPLQMLPIEIGMQAVRGVTSFQIRLDPAELGRVDVKLQIREDGEVKASLVVDRVETLHMLRRDASTLQQAFEQAGLKQSTDGLSFSLRGEGQQGQNPERGPQGSASVESDELALQAQMGEVAMRRAYIPNSSLDLMV